MDTKRAQEARNRELTQRQQEIIIGSLLGDGYLVKTTRGYAFRVNHARAQREYVEWKYRELEWLTNTPTQVYKNSCYFRTVSHSHFDGLRAAFYRQQQKILPSEIGDWMTPLAFSIWLMDDGARDKNQLRLNTQSFSLEENLRLIRILRGFARNNGHSQSR